MGLLRGVARTAAIAGTATAVSNRVSRRQANRWNNQQAESEQAVPEEAPVEQSTASGDDVYDQLAKLGQLKEQGIVTQAEFDAKKQQLLGL